MRGSAPFFTAAAPFSPPVDRSAHPMPGQDGSAGPGSGRKLSGHNSATAVTFHIIWHRVVNIIWHTHENMDELAGLSEEARKLAMERFSVLQPHLEQNEPLKSVAQAAGSIPYRTAHRLVSEYRRHGLAALVRKKRADRGESRRCLSLRSIDRFSSSRRIEEKSRPATELSSTLSDACPPISLLSPMTGRRHTATPSSWCNGEKRMGRTRSGKPITRRSTFC